MSDLPQETGRRTPRSMVVYRALATLLFVMTLVQVGLGAGYVDGDWESMNMHTINARVLVALALLTLLSGTWLRWQGGPVRAVIVNAVLLLAMIAQMVLGMERVVAVHVTLGVIIFAAVVVMVMRAWTADVPARARGEAS
ncbi:hypothetical protein ACFVZC_29565 [Streptomyces marokkonensis]|uniref:Integral membrane protein n=1 Tax=Streptomyces marokkonensis TaxID=324855 RepID=A0ABW6QET4_9ACTN